MALVLDSFFVRTRSHEPQHPRIIVFIDLVENDFEFLFLVGEELQGITCMLRSLGSEMLSRITGSDS